MTENNRDGLGGQLMLWSLILALDMLRRRSSSAEKGSILAFGTLAKAPKQLLQIPTASSSQVEALKRASVGSESDGDGSDDSIDGQRSSVELRGHSGSFLCRGRFVGVSQASTAVVSMVSVQEHPIMWIGGTDGSVAVWSTTVCIRRQTTAFSLIQASKHAAWTDTLGWYSNYTVATGAFRPRHFACAAWWNRVELFQI